MAQLFLQHSWFPGSLVQILLLLSCSEAGGKTAAGQLQVVRACCARCLGCRCKSKRSLSLAPSAGLRNLRRKALVLAKKLFTYTVACWDLFTEYY